MNQNNVQKGAEWDKMYHAIQNSKGNINIYFQNREYFTNNGYISNKSLTTGDGAQFHDICFGGQQDHPTETTGDDPVEDPEKLQSWIIKNCSNVGFSQFRESIINWLKNFILHKRNSMFQRANIVIGMLAQEDYYYFEHKNTKRFVSEKNSNMAIARFLFSILDHPICR